MGIFGKSDKQLIEENIAAKERHGEIKGGSIRKPQTQDERAIVETRNDFEARGYYWNGRAWVKP